MRSLHDRCPVSQAEIDNDQPYRSHNRDAMEEHDRATDNLRIERREFIESMLKNGYAIVKKYREQKTYELSDAIEMISDQNFWNSKYKLLCGGIIMELSINEIYELCDGADQIVDMYIKGELPQWHAEIHKQVALLADMALGEV